MSKLGDAYRSIQRSLLSPCEKARRAAYYEDHLTTMKRTSNNINIAGNSGTHLLILLVLDLVWAPILLAQEFPELESEPLSIEISVESTDANDTVEKSESEADLLAAEQARRRALEISREQAAREAAIIDLQSNLGVYSPELQEAYSDFGAFYREIEDYESAVEMYSEALQVARINTGLQSEQQLPIIEELVVTNTRQKDWQAVDDLKHLNYQIVRRLYEPDDESYLEAMQAFGSWKLRVIRENILDLPPRGILNTATDLSEFYERELSRIESQPSVVPESLLTMIYGKTQADLTLARSVAGTPYTAFQGNASRYVTETRCRNVRRNGQVVRDCVQVQVENPRYRQSQRDAKNFALGRYVKRIESSIERLRIIRATNRDLSASEIAMLDTQIAELSTESDQILRSGRSFITF
ncbi:MAG: hypothetical protein JJ934_19060 [Pseudomonadales bacterium]|nr:hypothetical protein [Pseudomonadales bacterium]